MKYHPRVCRNIIAVFVFILPLTLSYTVQVSGQDVTWWDFEQYTFQTIDTVIDSQDNPTGDTQAVAQDIAALEELRLAFEDAGLCPSEDICSTYERLIQSSKRIAAHDTSMTYSSQDWEAIALLKQAQFFYEQTGGAAAQPQVNGTAAQPQANGTDVQPQAAADPLAIEDPIPLEIVYRYRPTGQDEFVELVDGGAMQSGDYYQVVFYSEESCYLYIFQLDSAGKLNGIFPLYDFKETPIGEGNPVQAEQIYILPKDGKSFVLDDQTGEETIYLLAFWEPQPQLDVLYQQVLDAQNADDPQQIAGTQYAFLEKVHSKGIAQVADNETGASQTKIQDAPRQQGDDFFTFVQQLDMCDGCVRVLQFTHQ